MAYRRPHPVKDPRLAAARLLDARRALIELVLPPGTERAVEISNAIETLEAAAENYGAIRELEPDPPYVPVLPEELADVRRALEERSAELEARCIVCRGSGFVHGEPCGNCGGTGQRPR